MIFVIHYSEIALKGRNRPFFERALAWNIKLILKEFKPVVRRLNGRFSIDTEAGSKNQELKWLKTIEDKLRKVFGIAYFAPVTELEYRDAEDILFKLKQAVLRGLSRRRFNTFAIETVRSWKQFPKISQEVNEYLGDAVGKKFNKNVQLKNPDITVYVEILKNRAMTYFEKILGAGGLPAGVSGKIVSLISGGIDSPVASWQMMKRGAQVLFVHFHSYPFTSASSQDNVKELVIKLMEWQNKVKLYLVSFGEIQKEIVKHVEPKLRLLFYRRYMFQIAEQIAEKESALGLITGESLGQVASQTLENLRVIDAAINLPVFRPLIGFDKEEIVKRAREIGTYEISIRPFDDCCSFLVPEHPQTKAQPALLESYTKQIHRDIIPLMRRAIIQAEIVDFR